MSSNNNITNPKCSNCKCYFTPTVKSSGQPFKTCDKCRTVRKESNERNKCEHDKRTDRCKMCGGVGICEHNKRKSECKLCGGSEICEHDKIKYRCRKCGGNQLCEHNSMVKDEHPKKIVENLFSTMYYIEKKKNMFHIFSSISHT